MWALNWDSTNGLETSSVDEVIQKINELNQEYKDKQPIIIEIESDTRKSLTLGVGVIGGLSCLTYFPFPDGLGSMHLISTDKLGLNHGESIIFWLNSYDSEWAIEDLVTYEEAMDEVLYFLQNNDIDADLNWEKD